MPVNFDTFNTGTDLKTTITDLSTGAIIEIGGFITESATTSQHDLMEEKPIDRPTNLLRLSYGTYRCTLNVLRATGDLDDLESANFQDFITSGKNNRYTVTGSIQNQADDSFDEYQLQNCLLWIEDFGPYRKDVGVTMRVMIAAEQRVKVA